MLKLAVFVDDVQVTDQAVASFIPNKWNTFKLDVPVAIPKERHLNLVLTWNNTMQVNILSTLICQKQLMEKEIYTEDGGETWLKLSDSGLGSQLVYYRKCS